MEFIVKKVNEHINSDVFDKDNFGKFLFSRDGNLIINGCQSQAEADALIAAHNPPAPKEPTVEEKLAFVGLSLTDLKSALGLE